MLLSSLIQECPILEKRNFSDREITHVTSDSRSVVPGSLFVAIPGFFADGHQFIQQALAQGATALVVEKESFAPNTIPVFKVKNSRAALSFLAARWHGDPSHAMTVVGVTGTNGKTTLCCLLQAMCLDAGIRAGRIGTIGYQFGQKEERLAHTTPEPMEIHGILKEMQQSGIQSVFMEISSHALDMNRVDHVNFDMGVFTNLTPEHLDYHKTMELYFESKKKLFTQLLPQGKGLKRSILNAEDIYGLKLVEVLERQGASLWTYSTRAQSKWNLFVEKWTGDLSGSSGIIHTPEGTSEFHTPLIGVFNLSNVLAALATGLSLNIPLPSLLKTLENFSQVPGRLEKIPNKKQFNLFVDYAHTPDALKNVLKAIRALHPPKIITVFGCGGDRDRSKRPMMGREAALFSDEVILTNDNPRTEDPHQILEEILPGIEEGGMTLQKQCWIEPDRKQAIHRALATARPGDVVLVAGKGHEDYQILGTRKIHFDDREIIRDWLSENE